MAPLPEPEPRFPGDRTVTRYTVTWTLQLLEEPPGVPEAEEELGRRPTDDADRTERDA
jgi:hypothetical protein